MTRIRSETTPTKRNTLNPDGKGKGRKEKEEGANRVGDPKNGRTVSMNSVAVAALKNESRNIGRRMIFLFIMIYRYIVDFT